MHTKSTQTCFIESVGIIAEKVKYETFEDASEIAEIVNDLPTQIHKAVPFKCETCGYFHLYLKK